MDCLCSFKQLKISDREESVHLIVTSCSLPAHIPIFRLCWIKFAFIVEAERNVWVDAWRVHVCVHVCIQRYCNLHSL